MVFRDKRWLFVLSVFVRRFSYSRLPRAPYFRKELRNKWLEIAMKKWFIVHFVAKPRRSKKIIAGNGVFICNECVALSQEIIREKWQKKFWLTWLKLRSQKELWIF